MSAAIDVDDVEGETLVLFLSHENRLNGRCYFEFTLRFAVMEESHMVHSRRKNAARNREKTPQPPQYLENLTDDNDDARAKIEKMVETTEKMEALQAESRRHKILEIAGDKETKIYPSVNSDSFQSKQDFECKFKTGSDSKIDSSLEKDSSKNRISEKEGNTCKILKKKKTAKMEDLSVEDSAIPKRTKKRHEGLIEPPRKSFTHRSDDENEDGDERSKLSMKMDKSELKSANKSFIIKCDDEVHDDTKKEMIKNNRKKRTSSENRESSEVNKEDTEKQRFHHDTKFEELFLKKLESECKKQIVPLSKENLIEDFAKAQEEYLRRERNVIDYDPVNPFFNVRQDTIWRKRKPSIIHTESESEEIVQAVFQSDVNKSSFSWFNFLKLFKKTKVQNSYAEAFKFISKTNSSEDQQPITKEESEKVTVWKIFRALRDLTAEFNEFIRQNAREVNIICAVQNRCIVGLIMIIIYCGLGAFLFRFIEGAFENFYKCGVKRVKRDFLDSLWNYSHNLREDDWKSMARRKLMEFEEQLHAAHEAGVRSYSGQKSWSFLNSLVYCITVITKIGYGHIAPTTTTGRAITIIYAIFGIPMFLIILADFGKLFTRGMKFIWAFIRRLYYTGSCRKVRRTAPVQEVMKGVQLMYDFATFRRPSQMNPEEIEEMQKHGHQPPTLLTLDGSQAQRPENISAPDTPGTPNMSTFAIDDEFNLPISVAISILLGYIFVGATLYHLWENEWSFFESFYFVFISMSTIGFGDYVPTHPIYMMCSIVYLVFGLALTSMCINVVQVMLSDQFKHASQKIGATMGLEVEDDRSIQPVLLQPVEVADIYTAGRNSNSNEDILSKPEENLKF